MSIETFRENLLKAISEKEKDIERGIGAMFGISKEDLNEVDIDLRTYMDTEMQRLVTEEPYAVSYIPSISTSQELKFIDRTFGRDESGNYIYYSYNSEKGETEETIFDEKSKEEWEKN